MYDPNLLDQQSGDPDGPIEDNRLVRSKTIHSSEIMSYVVNSLLGQMGDLPKYFDTHIIVTVVLTPLPDELGTSNQVINNN